MARLVVYLVLACQLLAIAPFTVSALQAETPTPALVQDFPVLVAGASFFPAVLAVPRGATVTWIHVEGEHTVTTANSVLDAVFDQPNDPADTNCAADGEDGEDGNPDSCHVALSDGLASFRSFSHTFNAGGVFTYYCRTHFNRGMVGAVTVV